MFAVAIVGCFGTGISINTIFGSGGAGGFISVGNPIPIGEDKGGV